MNRYLLASLTCFAIAAALLIVLLTLNQCDPFIPVYVTCTPVVMP